MKNAYIHVRVATFFLFHEMILIFTINTMMWSARSSKAVNILIASFVTWIICV